MKKKITLMILLSAVLSCKLMASLVVLTTQGLGLAVGDQGHSVDVDGAFTISARTITDQPGGYSNANVWVSPLGIGAFGAEPPKGNVALDALQGGDDELIFDFGAPVNAGSIVLSLNNYNKNVDATTFRLVSATDGSEILLSDTEWSSAVTLDAANSVVIDMSKLSIDGGTTLASLAVRQTAGSVYVSSIEFTAVSTEVPEPATLAMLGAGCLVFVRKKKA